MMNTMEDKSLCGLIKFHSARLAEVAKDTEELQASIDNEVAEAYQKGFEDGKAVNDKGCEGCKYANVAGTHEPCVRCSNGYPNQWTAKADKIKVGDEVINIPTQTKGILLEPETKHLLATVIVPDQRWRTINIRHANLKKTGKHYDIEKILEAMKA